MTPPDSGGALRADELRAVLAGSRFSREVIVLDEVTSTNDYVWQRAREGAATGLVVFAERQTAGRGQRGNRWESASGPGLWFSLLLRPAITPAESARLTDWAARSVAETIETELHLKPIIKPPNDILLGGRKVSGVLVEMRVEAGGGYAAIVGIGVNVSQQPEDFPEELRDRAISLSMAAKRPVDRLTFATALLRRLATTCLTSPP